MAWTIGSFNRALRYLTGKTIWKELRTWRNEIHWSNVYRWHNRWSKDLSYVNLFETGIEHLRLANKLDLSILHGDGSNTVAKKGVEESGIPDTNIRKA